MIKIRFFHAFPLSCAWYSLVVILVVQIHLGATLGWSITSLEAGVFEHPNAVLPWDDFQKCRLVNDHNLAIKELEKGLSYIPSSGTNTSWTDPRAFGTRNCQCWSLLDLVGQHIALERLSKRIGKTIIAFRPLILNAGLWFVASQRDQPTA